MLSSGLSKFLLFLVYTHMRTHTTPASLLGWCCPIHIRDTSTSHRSYFTIASGHIKHNQKQAKLIVQIYYYLNTPSRQNIVISLHSFLLSESSDPRCVLHLWCYRHSCGAGWRAALTLLEDGWSPAILGLTHFQSPIVQHIFKFYELPGT